MPIELWNPDRGIDTEKAANRISQFTSILNDSPLAKGPPSKRIHRPALQATVNPGNRLLLQDENRCPIRDTRNTYLACRKQPAKPRNA